MAPKAKIAMHSNKKGSNWQKDPASIGFPSVLFMAHPGVFHFLWSPFILPWPFSSNTVFKIFMMLCLGFISVSCFSCCWSGVAACALDVRKLDLPSRATTTPFVFLVLLLDVVVVVLLLLLLLLDFCSCSSCYWFLILVGACCCWSVLFLLILLSSSTVSLRKTPNIKDAAR